MDVQTWRTPPKNTPLIGIPGKIPVLAWKLNGPFARST